MKEVFLLGLIQNIAVLLMFSMLYDYFWIRNSGGLSLLYKLGTGVFTGVVGIVLILTPWTFTEGIFFDTRSVLLSVSGLFLGAVPTSIAMLITATYRIILGGPGMWMGVAVILSSGIIGILWFYFRGNYIKIRPLPELVYMGIIVHLAMILCTLFVKSEYRYEMLEKILIPVLFVYPVANVLLGLLMLHQKRNSDNRKALDISEERWHFAIEGSGDGLWDWNVETGEIYFSEKWKQMLGYEDKDIPNMLDSWKKIIHKEDEERVYVEIEKLLHGEIIIYEVEQRLLCKDGSYKWILDRGKVMKWSEDGRAIRCLGTHRDITEAKNAEVNLQSYQEQLKNYASHLQHAREDERLLLAKEIHDELGQILIAVKIELGLLKQKVLREFPKNRTEGLIESFDILSGKINSTINTSRKIMTDLRPEVLHLLGLEEAVRLLVNTLESRYNIKFSFSAEMDDVNLNSHQTVALYRIFQEALNNTVKHANATEMNMTLYSYQGKVFLEINDNGSGITDEDVNKSNSYGIIGIKERVSFLDGSLKISGEKNKGTSIKVEFKCTE